MKKKLIAIIFAAMLLTGCGNHQVIDTVYTYNYAIIHLPNGVIVEGKVKKWCDYDGEQLQVQMADGKTYLCSSYNCVLINE